MNTIQLELCLNRKPAGAAGVRKPGRRTRASWWFAQMRGIVDAAFDWQPATPPRPEQIWFSRDQHRPGL